VLIRALWMCCTPLGLPEGAFYGVVWTLVILVRGALWFAARWCSRDVIRLLLSGSVAVM
jgi:hypothetical protein